MHPDTRRRHLELQGFHSLPDHVLRSIDPLLRITPAVVLLWVGAAACTGSVPGLVALSVALAFGGLRRGHAADWVYNRYLRPQLGAGPANYALGRRVSMVVASVWTLAVAGAVAAGAGTVAHVLSGSLVAASALNVATGFCLGSHVFAMLTGSLGDPASR